MSAQEPSGKAAERTPLRRWLVEPVTVLGGLTAGLSALLLGAGLLALGGRNHVLGIPDSGGSTGALTRTGYLFIADSFETLDDLATGQMATVPFADGVAITSLLALVIAAGGLLGWRAWHGRDPMLSSGERRTVVVLTWSVTVIASTYNLYTMFRLFEVSELLLNEPRRVTPRTNEIVTALLFRGADLRAVYAVHVVLTVLAAACAIWLWERSATASEPAKLGLTPAFIFDDTGQLPAPPRTARWGHGLLLAGIAIQLLCLPRAHGVYILTGLRPQCVTLSLRPELGEELEPPTGFLLTDASEDEIQQLQVSRTKPPTIMVFRRQDVMGIQLQKVICGGGLLSPPRKS